MIGYSVDYYGPHFNELVRSEIYEPNQVPDGTISRIEMVPDWIVEDGNSSEPCLKGDEFIDPPFSYSLARLSTPLPNGVRFVIGFPTKGDYDRFMELVSPVVEPTLEEDSALMRSTLGLSKNVVPIPECRLRRYTDCDGEIFMAPDLEVWEWCSTNCKEGFRFVGGFVKGTPKHVGVSVWYCAMEFSSVTEAVHFKLSGVGQ